MLVSWAQEPVDENLIIDVHYQGEILRMPLRDAVELDDPEGMVIVKISATFLKQCLQQSE